jgi:hypothetical protein
VNRKTCCLCQSLAGDGTVTLFCWVSMLTDCGFGRC